MRLSAYLEVEQVGFYLSLLAFFFEDFFPKSQSQQKALQKQRLCILYRVFNFAKTETPQIENMIRALSQHVGG